MPELPEVETIVNALIPHLEGKKICAVDAFTKTLRKPVNLPHLRKSCVGAKIKHLRRRAKYIIVELDNGNGLLLHLGMTGAFVTCSPKNDELPHERIRVTLSGRKKLSWRYIDTRKFGMFEAIKLPSPNEDPLELSGLGPEPLSDGFDGEYLFRISRKRKQSIKVLIMDQKLVTGVGNIYASEACFRAGINPRKAAAKVTGKQCDLLASEIKKVLQESIETGGTTIKDFKNVDGSEGKFVLKLNVYGKDKQPCPNCGASIQRTVLGGRSTYYCSRCQK